MTRSRRLRFCWRLNTVYDRDIPGEIALLEVNKRLEAANKAAAEIYDGATHLGTDKIRNIMARESRRLRFCWRLNTVYDRDIPGEITEPFY